MLTLHDLHVHCTHSLLDDSSKSAPKQQPSSRGDHSFYSDISSSEDFSSASEGEEEREGEESSADEAEEEWESEAESVAEKSSRLACTV